MSIALLIADDHELVRDGLRQTFARTDIDVVAEAATVEEARRLARDTAVDVMLLDLSWRRGQVSVPDGFALLEEIRAVRSRLAVLMYSIHDRRDYRDRCGCLGAAGYLVKGADDRRLVPAVHAAYAARHLWTQVPSAAPAHTDRRA